MISEAMMGVTAFKAAMDISKDIKDIDDRTRRNEAVIELQEKILSAQAAQAALVQAVSELEKEVTALKAWDAEKHRYELKDLWKGFFAFIPRQAMEKAAVMPSSMTGRGIAPPAKLRSKISGATWAH